MNGPALAPSHVQPPGLGTRDGHERDVGVVPMIHRILLSGQGCTKQKSGTVAPLDRYSKSDEYMFCKRYKKYTHEVQEKVTNEARPDHDAPEGAKRWVGASGRHGALVEQATIAHAVAAAAAEVVRRARPADRAPADVAGDGARQAVVQRRTATVHVEARLELAEDDLGCGALATADVAVLDALGGGGRRDPVADDADSAFGTKHDVSPRNEGWSQLPGWQTENLERSIRRFGNFCKKEGDRLRLLMILDFNLNVINSGS